MEACPRLPALSFDLKLSIESVNLCEKIPNYISTNYQENGEKFPSECEQINRLRQNATNCSMDENGLQYLKRYYAQLQLLRNRFPMLHDGECAVRFTWEDAYQKEDNTYDDIRFEETCILYNIGSLYSKLGASELRRTHESMKNTCTYYRYSAGCYEKLRDEYTPYSLDLTPDLLTCQIDILLGQAHEAVLEKSLLDQRPASVNAHLAMQISEYYQKALTNLLKTGMSSIVSKRFREWRVVLTYKVSYYLSIAYYFSGLIAEQSKKRGEAVCYFENALERLKEGWRNAEKISSDRTVIYKDVQTFTIEILTGKYKSTKRDNDSVYFEKVPVLASLPAIQGAVVAKPQAFDYRDPNVSGVDIFQKLIPMDTHLSTSQYSEEKAKVLRDIGQLIENKNRELETFLNCLQLNRLPLNNNHLQLPRELLDCCAGSTTNRSNIFEDLQSGLQKLNNEQQDMSNQLTQFEQVLETTSDSLQSTPEYQDIQRNLKSTRQLFSQANESSTELKQHVNTLLEHLQILQLPLEQFERHLPIVAELNDETNKVKLARLSLLNEKSETMKKQRETLLNDLRKKIQDDDITKLILLHREESHKNLFHEQLKKHDELTNLIKQNCSAQDQILQSLTEANADLAEMRTKILTTFENRQRMIEEYIHSFKSVDETLSKINEGIEFYKKQNDRINSWDKRLINLQSEEEKKMSTKRIQPKSDLPLPITPDRPRLKDYLPMMKPETWGSAKKEENLYQSPHPNPPMNNQFHNPNMPPEQTHFPSPTYPYHPYNPNLYTQSQRVPQQFYPPQMIYQPNPSIYSYQNFSDSNRPAFPQSLPPLPTKFDPYRPQPVGAYDIPQTVRPLLNPDGVYRPGGSLPMNSASMPSNSYEQTQYTQYIPSSTNSSSVASSFANLSMNSMLNQ